MTFKQKLEQSINSLYSEIKKLELSQDNVNEINIKGFLYSCGRLNQLQITAFLTIVAFKHNMQELEIIDLLKGEF